MVKDQVELLVLHREILQVNGSTNISYTSSKLVVFCRPIGNDVGICLASAQDIAFLEKW